MIYKADFPPDDRAEPQPLAVTRLLTFFEAGDHLGVSHQTVRRMAKRGEIDTVDLGRERRVPASEVERVLRERHSATQSETITAHARALVIRQSHVESLRVFAQLTRACSDLVAHAEAIEREREGLESQNGHGPVANGHGGHHGQNGGNGSRGRHNGNGSAELFETSLALVDRVDRLIDEFRAARTAQEVAARIPNESDDAPLIDFEALVALDAALQSFESEVNQMTAPEFERQLQRIRWLRVRAGIPSEV